MRELLILESLNILERFLNQRNKVIDYFTVKVCELIKTMQNSITTRTHHGYGSIGDEEEEETSRTKKYKIGFSKNSYSQYHREI